MDSGALVFGLNQKVSFVFFATDASSQKQCVAGTSGLVRCRREEEGAWGGYKVNWTQLEARGSLGPGGLCESRGEGGFECGRGGQAGVAVCLAEYFDDRAQLYTELMVDLGRRSLKKILQ